MPNVAPTLNPTLNFGGEGTLPYVALTLGGANVALTLNLASSNVTQTLIPTLNVFGIPPPRKQAED